MKKFIIYLICIFVLCLSCFLILKNKDNEDKNNKLKTVKVAEVAHSIFYAPQYVAIKKGFFQDENIKIDLSLTPGADKVTAAVLSGDVDVGFCGSEASIYVYNSNEKDYIVTFASLTKRDGSFIVSKKKIKNFTLKDLENKKIIGGRDGGMPEMTLEYALKKNNVDINKVDIDKSVDFALMASAFINSNSDFVTLFEPSATKIENEKMGYIVGYLGEYAGEVPYTSYNARKSYINNNQNVIEGFNKAITKGQEYVYTHNEEEIAKTIIDFFPDMTINELTKMIKRYKDNNAWGKNTYFKKEEFDRLQEIMINAGKLDKKVDYNKLVNTKYMIK
jgi:NitT/TauT family transport system substrate-binding protein